MAARLYAVNEATEIPALILISSLSFLTICQASFEVSGVPSQGHAKHREALKVMQY